MLRDSVPLARFHPSSQNRTISRLLDNTIQSRGWSVLEPGQRNQWPSLGRAGRWSRSACSRPSIASTDDAVWSIYGAERGQPVASGRKSKGRKNGSNKPKPLPPIATGCRSGRMVRRGSTVRVRQRACKIPAHGDFSGRLALDSACSGYGAVNRAFKHASRPLPPRGGGQLTYHHGGFTQRMATEGRHLLRTVPTFPQQDDVRDLEPGMPRKT